MVRDDRCPVLTRLSKGDDRKLMVWHQARTDFAAIEGDLQFIMGQLARMPTRAFLCRTLLLAAASIWTLLTVVLLIRQT